MCVSRSTGSQSHDIQLSDKCENVSFPSELSCSFSGVRCIALVCLFFVRFLCALKKVVYHVTKYVGLRVCVKMKLGRYYHLK